MNYIESKKELDKITSKYNCKGDIIMRTAIQYIVEYGRQTFKDEGFIEDQIKTINDRHDAAEAEGKWLIMTRDFELALFNCARELAEIDTYNLIIYMQKEMYWSNEGGIDYGRLKEITARLMYWIIDSPDSCEDYDIFSNECDISDEELETLGFRYLIKEEDDYE